MDFFTDDIPWKFSTDLSDFICHDSTGRFVPIFKATHQSETPKLAQRIAECLQIQDGLSGSTIKYAVSEIIDNSLQHAHAPNGTFVSPFTGEEPKRKVRVMNTTISVKTVVQDTSVVGRYQGGDLRRRVLDAVNSHGEVTVDFEGIEVISQSAADEFVGRIVRYSEEAMDRITFVRCSDIVKWMIQWAADNANSVLEHQTHEIA